MRFRRGARLDPGQATDVRGRRAMRPGGLAVGGGGIGLVVLLVYVLVAVLGGGGLGDLSVLEGQRVGVGDTPGEVSTECRTGEDANERQDCRIVAVVNSVQKFWIGAFERSGERYPFADTVFFTDQVRTGCGFASSQVGPFYCPHEYGHHVQNQVGVLDRVRGDQQGPESLAVRSELQADCYGGVWAVNAVEMGLIEQLTQADINEALDAATAIGDGRIQERMQGQVNPETWTHGSSEQRRRWFSRGYEQGRPAACDTFSGSI